MTWMALIVSGASLAVLGAVLASGLGPASSLRRTASRFGELREEVDGLRRGLDRLKSRRRRELH